MQRMILVPVMLASMAALSGCLPMMALSAVSMAANSARGTPQSNAHLAPAAEAACTTTAAQYGTVHVIDVQQKSVGKIIVWGTAGDGAAKQSFECHFGTKIDAFKLRVITPRK